MLLRLLQQYSSCGTSQVRLHNIALHVEAVKQSGRAIRLGATFDSDYLGCSCSLPVLRSACWSCMSLWRGLCFVQHDCWRKSWSQCVCCLFCGVSRSAPPPQTSVVLGSAGREEGALNGSDVQAPPGSVRLPPLCSSPAVCRLPTVSVARWRSREPRASSGRHPLRAHAPARHLCRSDAGNHCTSCTG